MPASLAVQGRFILHLQCLRSGPLTALPQRQLQQFCPRFLSSRAHQALSPLCSTPRSRISSPRFPQCLCPASLTFVKSGDSSQISGGCCLRCSAPALAAAGELQALFRSLTVDRNYAKAIIKMQTLRTARIATPLASNITNQLARPVPTTPQFFCPSRKRKPIEASSPRTATPSAQRAPAPQRKTHRMAISPLPSSLQTRKEGRREKERKTAINRQPKQGVQLPGHCECGFEGGRPVRRAGIIRDKYAYSTPTTNQERLETRKGCGGKQGNGRISPPVLSGQLSLFSIFIVLSFQLNLQPFPIITCHPQTRPECPRFAANGSRLHRLSSPGPNPRPELAVRLLPQSYNMVCCGSRASVGAVWGWLGAVAVWLIQMSSNRFLQRFEGKIQTVGKTGIQGLFGTCNTNATALTNPNFYTKHKNKTATSLGKPKPAQDPPAEHKISMHEISRQVEKQEIKEEVRGNERSSEKVLFLPSISHPYQQAHRKTEEQPQAVQANEVAKQSDKRKKTNCSSRSLQKRRDSALGKLGGLGANIGGEEWVLRKKKLQKMQAFAQQVKLSCRQMPKMPKQQKRSLLEQQRCPLQEGGLSESLEQG